MTLLANEAAKESSGILAKYGKPKAKNHADLEVKLAELYFEQPDKKQLEKELAEIHPHKKWLVRTLELEPKGLKETVVTEAPTQAETNAEQIKNIEQVVSESIAKFSGFNGSNNADTSNKSNVVTDWLPFVAIIGMVSITMIVVAKSNK